MHGVKCGKRQEAQQVTAVWHNGGCSASYDSFVVGSSAVLRLNFCAKNPPLRQAAKRQTVKKLFDLPKKPIFEPYRRLEWPEN
jgi:hypothetical protein